MVGERVELLARLLLERGERGVDERIQLALGGVLAVAGAQPGRASDP